MNSGSVIGRYLEDFFDYSGEKETPGNPHFIHALIDHGLWAPLIEIDELPK